MISLIVAASTNHVIGVQGELPWRLSDDLKAQHGQVASALKGSQSHRSAAAAYRKPQD